MDKILETHFSQGPNMAQKVSFFFLHEAKNVFLFTVTLFSFIFKHTNSFFWRWPFSSDFLHGLAHIKGEQSEKRKVKEIRVEESKVEESKVDESKVEEVKVEESKEEYTKLK